ncbi:MAG: hypothetical protein QF893_20685 [Alphaproteobacteria bacterium]|jgi:hypothetical protein|nr:hypothetical protein [Alphaproteobacteria bacterium]
MLAPPSAPVDPSELARDFVPEGRIGADPSNAVRELAEIENPP